VTRVARLALLLIRIAETTTGATWAKIADEFGLPTLGTFTGPAGTFRQTAELTKTQRDIPLESWVVSTLLTWGNSLAAANAEDQPWQ